MKMYLEGEKKKLPAGEEKRKKRSRDGGKKKRGGRGKPRRKWWEEKEKKKRSDWGENTKQNWPGDGERKRRGSGERPANHSLLPELCTPLMVKLQSKTSIYFGKKNSLWSVWKSFYNNSSWQNAKLNAANIFPNLFHFSDLHARIVNEFENDI